MKIKKDPWTDPDPQPGDFDEEIEHAEPVEVVLDPRPRPGILIRDEDAEFWRLPRTRMMAPTRHTAP